MIYLSQTLYLWGLAAFALGVAAVFLAPRGDGKGRRDRRNGLWLASALSLFVVGALAALAHVLPGRAGLWLETGVLALAAYGLGCLVGAALAAPFEIFRRGAAASSSARAAYLRGRLLPEKAPAIAARASAAPALSIDETAPQPPSEPSAPQVPAAEAEAAADAVAQALLRLMAPPVTRAATEQPDKQDKQEKKEAADESVAPGKTRAGVARVQEDERARPPAIERPEQQDDLCLIRGVNPKLAQTLHEIGVWRFSQIAAWEPKQVAWIARRLGKKAPVSPRHWPPQARLLAAGALTDYARAVLRGGPVARDAGEEALAAWVAALPAPATPGAGDGFYAGARPPGFSEPPLGECDDLTRLSGVDDEMASRLNALGVWTWRQIACWSAENARWIGAYLATPGAPEREDWVGQARALCAPFSRAG